MIPSCPPKQPTTQVILMAFFFEHHKIQLHFFLLPHQQKQNLKGDATLFLAERKKG